MSKFDDLQGCYQAAAPVPGLCRSSVLDVGNPHCGHSAALAPDCAIAPDGSIYIADENDDEYVSGTGWRSLHFVSDNGSTRPASANLTVSDIQRCGVALCAPSCDGRSGSVGTFLPDLCGGDSGASGAQDAAAAD